jgi:hypothetical protein
MSLSMNNPALEDTAKTIFFTLSNPKRQTILRFAAFLSERNR